MKIHKEGRARFVVSLMELLPCFPTFTTFLPHFLSFSLSIAVFFLNHHLYIFSISYRKRLLSSSSKEELHDVTRRFLLKGAGYVCNPAEEICSFGLHTRGRHMCIILRFLILWSSPFYSMKRIYVFVRMYRERRKKLWIIVLSLSYCLRSFRIRLTFQQHNGLQ